MNTVHIIPESLFPREIQTAYGSCASYVYKNSFWYKNTFNVWPATGAALESVVLLDKWEEVTRFLLSQTKGFIHNGDIFIIKNDNA